METNVQKIEFNPIVGHTIIDGLPHKWLYCNHCRTFCVQCGKCQNNCCNALSPNNCADNCKEAYELQDKWFNSPEYLVWINSEDYKIREQKAEEVMQRFWKKLGM